MSYFIDSSQHPLPASTPRHLIEHLRATSKVGRNLSLSAYMIYFAHLFEEVSEGVSLCIDSPDALVIDLIAQGWLFAG